MKRIYYILVAVMCMSVFAGCNKDDENKGGVIAPTVEVVRSHLYYNADATVYFATQKEENEKISIGGMAEFTASGTVTVDCVQDWCTPQVSGNKITVTVDPNATILSRVAEVTLTSGDYTTSLAVYQYGVLP